VSRQPSWSGCNIEQPNLRENHERDQRCDEASRLAGVDVPFVHHRREFTAGGRPSLDWMLTSKFPLNILINKHSLRIDFLNRPNGRYAARSNSH
jgi:hypothetical protein